MNDEFDELDRDMLKILTKVGIETTPDEVRDTLDKGIGRLRRGMAEHGEDISHISDRHLVLLAGLMTRHHLECGLIDLKRLSPEVSLEGIKEP